MQISLKLELCGANEVDIRNQRPQLRRNRLILVEKAGGGILSTSSEILVALQFNFTPHVNSINRVL